MRGFSVVVPIVVPGEPPLTLSLAVDIERLERVNKTLSLLPEHLLEQTPLKPVKLLVIAPSERLDDIASRHVGSLPAPIRKLLLG